MNVLMLLLAAGVVAQEPKLMHQPPPTCQVEQCVEGCTGEDTCYTLVLKYQVNLAMPMQPPVFSTREIFTEVNYMGLTNAYCGARKIRREGYVVPTDAYPNDGNVMPDIITPMPVI